MSKLKILVVEDEWITARDIKNSLEKLDYVVSEPVATGKDAIQKAIEFQPDVILMDIVLQGEIDGIEAAASIQSRYQVPIVFLTAYSDRETLQRANLTQPFGYLVKPFEDRVLDTTIQIALARHQAAVEMKKAIAVSEALRQDAERERQRKSQYVAIASHEFRNPISIIKSSAEMLQIYGEKWGEEKRRKHLQWIQLAANSINLLLEDVLALEKTESGKLTANPQLLQVASLCRNLVEVMQLSAGEQYSLTFTCQDELTESLGALLDEQFLWHILNNLLSNAIKYSPKGGHISLTLSCQDGQLCFQVQDPGIGISADDQKRLFEPFFRGKNVGQITGTGLGLTIVKRSVELQGGQITVESEVGRGTTFTVQLPLIYPNPPSTEA
ncbi:MAG TPA: ATP-binding protein [Allocoleopsis sp.]